MCWEICNHFKTALVSTEMCTVTSCMAGGAQVVLRVVLKWCSGGAQVVLRWCSGGAQVMLRTVWSSKALAMLKLELSLQQLVKLILGMMLTN